MNKAILPVVIIVLFGNAATAAIISDGLVSYWAADGNATNQTNSSFNGVFDGSYTSGVNGQAFLFNGTNSVNVPDSSLWSMNGDLTWSMWVRFDVLPYQSGNHRDIQTFLSHDVGSGNNNKWFLSNWDGDLLIHANPPTTFVAFGQPSWQTAQWYHIAITKSGFSYSAYINGNLLNTTTNPYVYPDPATSLRFGFAERDGNQNHALIGAMDDIAYYRRALTSSEVAQLAGISSTIPEPSTLFLVGIGLGTLFVRPRTHTR